jgi:uncharacterized membrane protein
MTQQTKNNWNAIGLIVITAIIGSGTGLFFTSFKDNRAAEEIQKIDIVKMRTDIDNLKVLYIEAKNEFKEYARSFNDFKDEYRRDIKSLKTK